MAQRRRLKARQTSAKQAETFWVWARSLVMLPDPSLVSAPMHRVSGSFFWSEAVPGCLTLRWERLPAEACGCYLDTCKQPCWQQEEFGFPLGSRGLGSQLAGTQLGLPADSAIFTLLGSKVYLPVASSPRFVSSIPLSGVWAAAKPKPNPVVQTGKHRGSRAWF